MERCGCVASLQIELESDRPRDTAYPKTLTTIGDHLRKARLDKGLSQLKVAEIIGVTTDSITGWELNRHEPYISQMRGIISFLGYNPYEKENGTLRERFKVKRYAEGLSFRKAAKIVGCDQHTLQLFESGKRKTSKETIEKIDSFLKC